ncbi:conserved hypothetical protein [Candidatus Sulfopaludibacter sp. SbA4]|nr:conserved hypothetical protein [Candidatus Sulfopaludibacter sp. SbA4]
MEQSDTRIWIRAISVWEISIKTSLNRLKISETAEERISFLLEQGCSPLVVKFAHAFAVRTLPLHHRDPFDRMLVAQAQCEDLTLVTADPAIMAYDIRTMDAST